jgi:hypothetical protein
VASHLTFRMRQGMHDLFALWAPFPVLPRAVCRSLPEVFIVGGEACLSWPEESQSEDTEGVCIWHKLYISPARLGDTPEVGAFGGSRVMHVL